MSKSDQNDNKLILASFGVIFGFTLYKLFSVKQTKTSETHETTNNHSGLEMHGVKQAINNLEN